MNIVYLVTCNDIYDSNDHEEIDRAFNEYYHALDYIKDMNMKMKSSPF